MPYVDVMTKDAKAIVELRSPGYRASPAATKLISTEHMSVLELVGGGEGEIQTSATKRPKRKASSGWEEKMNEYTNSENIYKKQKLPASEKKKKAQGAADPNQTIIIKEIKRTFEEYTYKPDSNEFYVEETAHIYHNPPFPSEWTNGVTIEDLRPIPLPPPLPSFPKSGSCQWSFDDSSRVLIADFSVGKNNGGQSVMTLEDSKFLFEMHERDDITVISRGLLNMSKVDPSLWSLEYLRKCVGREFYHKFRRFDRIVDENGIETYTEKDTLYSMRFEDYVQYCERRESHLKEGRADVEEPTFTFEDHLGKTHILGVWSSALYMIDVDIKRLTPLLNENFLNSFELPAVLPGGSHCMMNSVSTVLVHN